MTPRIAVLSTINRCSNVCGDNASYCCYRHNGRLEYGVFGPYKSYLDSEFHLPLRLLLHSYRT